MKEGYQNPPKAQDDPVPELIELLGRPFVFIAWPLGVKGTRRFWGHLRHDDMTPDYLAKLKSGNIGVALGAVSGGLGVIDFDDSCQIEPFLKLNPELRNTLQTCGQRGRSFWMRFKGDYPQKLSILRTSRGDVGEFRVNGSQSIIWGIHPITQKPYRFVNKAPVLHVDFEAIRWPKSIKNPPVLQSIRNVVNSVLSLDSVPSVPSVKPLEELVDDCIPEKGSQNHRALFRLNRGLMGRTLAEKMTAFGLWYGRAAARGVLRHGRAKDEYLAEFLDGARACRIPLGESPVERAWKFAQSETPPREAEVFSSPEAQSLVALCFQLDKLAAGEPWFLSSRTAGHLCGLSFVQAAAYLRVLVEIRVLEITEKHTATTATRYRYVKVETTSSNSKPSGMKLLG